jgi:hypothetical protein
VKSDGAIETPIATLPAAETPKPAAGPREVKPAKEAKPGASAKAEPAKENGDDGKSADVVSLDAFRKK